MFLPRKWASNAWYASLDELGSVFSGYFSTRGRNAEIWTFNTALDVFRDSERFRSVYIETLFGRLEKKISAVKLILAQDIYDDFRHDAATEGTLLRANLLALNEACGGALNRLFIRSKGDVDSSALKDLRKDDVVGFCAVGGQLSYPDFPLFFYRLDDAFHRGARLPILVASLLRDDAGFEPLRTAFIETYREQNRFQSVADDLGLGCAASEQLTGPKDVRVLIVVALREELGPIIREVFPELKPVGIGSPEYFEGTIRSDSKVTYHIFAVWCRRMGNVHSAIVTTAGCIEFNPDYVVLLGLAGGRRGNKIRNLGDVVYGTEYIAYEYEKLHDRGWFVFGQCGAEDRSRKFDCEPALLEMAEATSDSESWSREIASGDAGGRVVQVRAVGGKVLTGSKVVACKRFLDAAVRTHPEALAVEMEAEGVVVGARVLGRSGIMIKGVSDWADGTKGGAEDAAGRRVAARSAALFLRDALERGALRPPP